MRDGDGIKRTVLDYCKLLPVQFPVSSLLARRSSFRVVLQSHGWRFLLITIIKPGQC